MHAQYVAVASAVAVVRGRLAVPFRSVLDDKMKRPYVSSARKGDARSGSIRTGPGRYCAASSV